MNKQYLYKSKIYSIINCTKEDIPVHIEKVSSYWSEQIINLQEHLLENCINTGLAKQLVNDKNQTQAVIYGTYYNNRIITSYLLWMRSKKLFSLLAYYLRTKSDITTILFKPHTMNPVPFEFMVKPSSIRRYYSHNSPLVIDLYSPVNKELGYHLFREGLAKEI